MACPVCARNAKIKKAIQNKFTKQDIQDLIRQLKEQRMKDLGVTK